LSRSTKESSLYQKDQKEENKHVKMRKTLDLLKFTYGLKTGFSGTMISINSSLEHISPVFFLLIAVLVQI